MRLPAAAQEVVGRLGGRLPQCEETPAIGREQMRDLLEKIEDNYLSDIEELWQQQILPQLPGTRTGSRISLPNIPALPASTTDEATRPLSTDLQLLIAQMQALQQVVGDLQATLHQSLTIPRRLE